MCKCQKCAPCWCLCLCRHPYPHRATQTADEYQALHLCARFGHLEVLELLLEQGVDVNCTDKVRHEEEECCPPYPLPWQCNMLILSLAAWVSPAWVYAVALCSSVWYSANSEQAAGSWSKLCVNGQGMLLLLVVELSLLTCDCVLFAGWPHCGSSGNECWPYCHPQAADARTRRRSRCVYARLA